ncbi:MAG: hypothetical protein Q9221_005694 [Calogaya cf. arnoldii]
MNFHDHGSIRDLHAASRERSRTYTVDQERQQQLCVPSPALFEDLDEDLDAAQSDKDKYSEIFPSIAQCAVHLELLECFKLLRETVIKSNHLDVLFDTLPQKRYTTSYVNNGRGRRVLRRRPLRPIKDHDSTFQERRKKKWQHFVGFAYLRFQIWAFRINDYGEFGGKGRNEKDQGLLPPIGITSYHCVACCMQLTDR